MSSSGALSSGAGISARRWTGEATHLRRGSTHPSRLADRPLDARLEAEHEALKAELARLRSSPSLLVSLGEKQQALASDIGKITAHCGQMQRHIRETHKKASNGHSSALAMAGWISSVARQMRGGLLALEGRHGLGRRQQGRSVGLGPAAMPGPLAVLLLPAGWPSHA